MRFPPLSISYESISLRLLSPKDGVAIFDAVNHSLPELKKFMAWAHYVEDLESAYSIYADFEAKSLRGEEVSFAGFDQNGDLLFCVSLVPGSRLNEFALELGYWVHSKHTQKGLGTLAARIMTVLAFNYYSTNRLSVLCNTQNQRSLCVIEKCGFRFEGVLRNYLANPTPVMLLEGYSTVQDASSFSLTPQDISQLPWFDAVREKLVLHLFSQEMLRF